MLVLSGIISKKCALPKNIKTDITKHQYTFMGFKTLYAKKNETKKAVIGMKSVGEYIRFRTIKQK